MDRKTFDIVADTIAEECAVPRDKITPDSHVVEDLGLDSIGFLDLCYTLDVKLHVRIPYEQWVNDINAGKINTKELFLVSNLVNEISKLIAQRDAGQSA
jgi:acyl carrier protein